MLISRKAFTLIELLVVLSIISIISGLAIYMGNQCDGESEKYMIDIELSRIAEACRKFNLDMGENPWCIAELMISPEFSPDPTNEKQGWWWRGTDREKCTLYNLIIRRGWNGPYVKTEFSNYSNAFGDQSNAKACEFVVVDNGGNVEYTKIESDPTLPNQNDSAKRSSLLLSDYTYYHQSGMDKDGKVIPGTFVASHYQLDFSGTHGDTLFVRFVKDPRLDENNPQAKFADGSENIVTAVDTGLKLEDN